MKKRFIFDENYIKKYAKKDKFKWLIIGAVALAIILVIIIIIMANRKPKSPSSKNPVTPVFELKEELVVEAGSEIPEVVDYFQKLENYDLNSIKITYPEDFEVSYDTSMCSDEETEKINNTEEYNIEDFDCVVKTLRNPATYGITLTIQDKEYTVRLIVQDTKVPMISLKNVEIYVGNTYSINDFINYCTDASGDCEIYYSDKDTDESGNVIDYAAFKNPGTYEIRIFAKDKYGNTTETIATELKILESESTMHTVTFNSNGGSSVGSLRAPDGSTIVEPTQPTRNGYTFTGWYLNNVRFDFSTKISSSITLVAKWSKDGENPSGPTDPGVINVRSISLNFKKINLIVGESKTVTATISPSNATNKTVTWSSGDSSIATVSNGKITGVKAGTTIITATSGGKSASVQVVVKDQGAGGSCGFGDANYNTQFVLSVNLINNNCAVDPNRGYDQINTVSAKEYRKLVDNLVAMGFSTSANYFEHKIDYAYVKNTAGTGLVGVQITMTVNVIDPSNPYVYMTAQYIIKPDGSRQFIKNNIQKNGINFQ